MKGKLNTSGVVVIGTEDALDGRVRRKSIRTTVLFLRLDAYHLKGEITHLYVISQQ